MRHETPHQSRPRLADEVSVTRYGLEIEGERIPWSTLVSVGGAVDEGRRVFEVVYRIGPLGADGRYPPAEDGSGITTRSWGERDDRPDDFDGDALRILANAEPHCARAVRLGWLGRPTVSWERVEARPDAEGRGAGGYREREAEPVVARRTSTSLENLLAWVVSARDAPREIVVTPNHVYARRADGYWRVSLDTLADRRDAVDRVYVFGRRAELTVLHRDGCPVEAALDAALAARGWR